MAAVQVSNFAELKTAIEDATSAEITVMGDITFTSGARVNIAKSSLVIDFAGHSVTDSSISAFFMFFSVFLLIYYI